MNARPKGLTARVFEGEKQFISQLNNEIDYEDVDNRMSRYAKESVNWLGENLIV